jgi:CDP-diacylglycerol--glycerol-3-phosphate 3-phosphatidyltransferase
MRASARRLIAAALPNILTASRIAAAPILVLAASGQSPILAAGLAIFAAMTDFLDGAAARALGGASDFGAVFDPIADKMFILTALVLLLGDGSLSGPNAWAVYIILWREILTAGFRDYARTRGFGASVSFAAKLKTATQYSAVILLFASRIEPQASDIVFMAGASLVWAAAGLALYSAADYLWRARRRAWK